MTTEEPSVGTVGQDQGTPDPESPSQGWKEPDRLELRPGGERLSLGRVKVRLGGVPLLTHSLTQPPIHKLTTPGRSLPNVMKQGQVGRLALVVTLFVSKTANS